MDPRFPLFILESPSMIKQQLMLYHSSQDLLTEVHFIFFCLKLRNSDQLGTSLAKVIVKEISAIKI